MGLAITERLNEQCSPGDTFFELLHDLFSPPRDGLHCKLAIDTISWLALAELYVLEGYSQYLPRSASGRCTGGFACFTLQILDEMNAYFMGAATMAPPDLFKIPVGQFLISGF